MPVLGALSLAWELDLVFAESDQAPPDQVVVAIGNPTLRQTWQYVLEQMSSHLGVVIHPRASVSATAQIEVGAFYWTDLAPDIVNSEREEQGSISV
jgi:hypothetical protein